MTDPSRGHPRLRSGRQIINNPSRIVTPGGGTHLAPRTGRIINAAHLTFGTLNLTGDTIELRVLGDSCLGSIQV